LKVRVEEHELMVREVEGARFSDGEEGRVELDLVFKAGMRHESASFDEVNDLEKIRLGGAVGRLRRVQIVKMGEAQQMGRGD
jgi:hypothetical protein